MLYSADLNTLGVATGTPWNSSPMGQWEGLRIDPTVQGNVNLSVDWIRLTDCNAINTSVTWQPDSGVSAIWLTSSSTGQSILVASGISGTSGNYTLDTQGVAPGTYQVRLGTNTSCCSTTTPSPSSLVINQAPIATFNRPSFTSGVDYATQAGNPWDFNDSADVTQINSQWGSYAILPGLQSIDGSTADGVMKLTTISGTPSNIADPYFYLNTPQQIPNGGQYRYLTFRMDTQWPSQNAPDGMIVRWAWQIPGTIPTNTCELVGWDIPFDVGWQTLTVDLSDSFAGSVEQTGGLSCPTPPPSWSNSSPVKRMRFKSNENILGQNLIQYIDWIRLTSVDSVTHGTVFPVQIALNKNLQGTTFGFYYTTTPTQPTQHVAQQQNNPPPGRGPNFLYLPLVVRDFNQPVPPILNAVSFPWDTSSVAPGTYYVCVVANDGQNQATYCSEAPVAVN
jgi:hypothetical protein